MTFGFQVWFAKAENKPKNWQAACQCERYPVSRKASSGEVCLIYWFGNAFSLEITALIFFFTLQAGGKPPKLWYLPQADFVKQPIEDSYAYSHQWKTICMRYLSIFVSWSIKFQQTQIITSFCELFCALVMNFKFLRRVDDLKFFFQEYDFEDSEW